MQRLEVGPHDHHSVFSTWEISYRDISSQCQGASRLLQLWSCLDANDLWFGLFTPSIARHAGAKDLMPKWLNELARDEFEFLDCISHLLKYSFIMRLSDSGGYSMHSLVHVWARTLLEENSLADFIVLAILIVGSAVPSYWEADSWTLRRRLLPHADRCRRMVLNNGEKGYDWQAGSNAYKNTDPRSQHLLEAVNNLGNLFTDLGELGKAEELYRLALTRITEALGPDNLSTTDIIDDLGDLYYAQCKYEEAENLYVRALAMKQKSLGLRHPSTLDTNTRLAQLYHSQCRLDVSNQIYLRVLSDCEEALGSQHPSTLSTMINMGRLYQDQGFLDKAESMYRHALVTFESIHGPKSLIELSAISNLGHLLSYQGRLEDAMKMCREAMEGLERVLGLNHPSTLESLLDLGGLYIHQGSLEDAKKMYQQALIGYEECFGYDHLSTLSTRRSLAVVLLEEGRLAEAKSMFDSARIGLEGLLGADHPATQTGLGDLALALKSFREQNRPDFVQREIAYSNLNSIGNPSMKVPIFIPSLRFNRRTRTEKLD